jgi:hypothetical protein
MSDKDNATTGDDQAPLATDPPGGHSKAAGEDAERKMGVKRESDDDKDQGDPSGEHDPAALEDARRKMGRDG